MIDFHLYILSRYRPDLITWEDCRKGDTARNCNLAFSIAESFLAIPALLDTQDMLNTNKLDRLSILTYLSEMYHVLEGKNKFRSRIREDFSEDSGVSSDSSGTSSPVREIPELTQSNDSHQDSQFYKQHLTNSRNVCATKQSCDQSLQISIKKTKDVDPASKSNEDGLVQRRIQTKNYQTQRQEQRHSIDLEETNQSSLFAVGFKKFSNLAVSTPALYEHRTAGVRTQTQIHTHRRNIYTQTDNREVYTQTHTVNTYTQTENNTQTETHFIMAEKPKCYQKPNQITSSNKPSYPEFPVFNQNKVKKTIEMMRRRKLENQRYDTEHNTRYDTEHNTRYDTEHNTRYNTEHNTRYDTEHNTRYDRNTHCSQNQEYVTLYNTLV